MTSLDIDLLRAFVLVAETAGFTTAGSALGATQSAVSLRIRKLEERLGRRLLERTPRSVRLTPAGDAFMRHARAILAAHDEALRDLAAEPARRTLRLGVSDHAAASRLPAILRQLGAAAPELALSVTLGFSHELRERFDRDELDAVVVRRDAERRDGVPLFREPLVWAAGEGLPWRRGAAVPLIALPAPCGVRAAALRALERAGLGWREALTCTGVSAVQAAVAAGLGVAPLGLRHVPDRSRVLGEELPVLPELDVVLYARTGEPGLSRPLAALAALFRTDRSPAPPSPPPVPSPR